MLATWPVASSEKELFFRLLLAVRRCAAALFSFSNANALALPRPKKSGAALFRPFRPALQSGRPQHSLRNRRVSPKEDKRHCPREINLSRYRSLPPQCPCFLPVSEISPRHHGIPTQESVPYLPETFFPPKGASPRRFQPQKNRTTFSICKTGLRDLFFQFSQSCDYVSGMEMRQAARQSRHAGKARLFRSIRVGVPPRVLPFSTAKTL